MAQRARLVLASSSPRRADLLASVGVSFDTMSADVAEQQLPGESAAAMVDRLARGKAHAIAQDRAWVVIGGDTTVLVEGTIFEKPVDDQDARRMLRSLSGADHQVLTGIAVAHNGEIRSRVDVATVWMRSLSAADIDWYLGTGEHRGKAGAYAIQGSAAAFVERIDGDYNSIVGLPLAGLDRLLSAFGLGLGDFR